MPMQYNLMPDSAIDYYGTPFSIFEPVMLIRNLGDLGNVQCGYVTDILSDWTISVAVTNFDNWDRLFGIEVSASDIIVLPVNPHDNKDLQNIRQSMEVLLSNSMVIGELATLGKPYDAIISAIKPKLTVTTGLLLAYADDIKDVNEKYIAEQVDSFLD